MRCCREMRNENVFVHVLINAGLRRLFRAGAGRNRVTGCAVGPKYQQPTRPLRRHTRKWAIGRPRSPAIRIWAATGGSSSAIPQLNALEQQINVSNQNLKAAVAQYQQARAVLRYYRADYYPTITACTLGQLVIAIPTTSPATLDFERRDIQRFHRSSPLVLPDKCLGTSEPECRVVSRAGASQRR